jgi:hypothetical protein
MVFSLSERHLADPRGKFTTTQVVDHKFKLFGACSVDKYLCVWYEPGGLTWEPSRVECRRWYIIGRNFVIPEGMIHNQKQRRSSFETLTQIQDSVGLPVKVYPLNPGKTLVLRRKR